MGRFSEAGVDMLLSETLFLYGCLFAFPLAVMLTSNYSRIALVIWAVVYNFIIIMHLNSLQLADMGSPMGDGSGRLLSYWVLASTLCGICASFAKRPDRTALIVFMLVLSVPSTFLVGVVLDLFIDWPSE